MITNPELSNRIRSKNWPSPAITQSELTEASILQLVDWGIQVLAICPHGTYRSGLVTNRLNSIDIPTLRLDKGIEGILNKYISESVFRSLSKIPIIAGIMPDWEYEYYSKQSNLIAELSRKTNLTLYGSDDPAVEEIRGIYNIDAQPISSFDARCY